MNNYEQHLKNKLQDAEEKIEHLYYQMSMTMANNASLTVMNADLMLVNNGLTEALRIAHAVVCEKCSNRDVPKHCHKCWVTEDKDGRKMS